MIPNHDNGHEIRSGNVVCTKTGEKFEIINGALYLISSDDINNFQKKDQIEVNNFNRRIDEQKKNGTIPKEFLASEEAYLKETEARTDFLFSSLIYQGTANRFVLEIGAGDTKITQKFSELGFNCFALDFAEYRICQDSDEYFKNKGKYFERVIALMNKLPFQDHFFDIVISHASLHHATPTMMENFEWFNPDNMLDTLSEIKRVLKPKESGGIFIATGEGVYPDDILPENRKLEHTAMTGGPYEAHYTMSEYISLFKKVGLFPTFFSNAIDGNLTLNGYLQDGRKIDLIKAQNYISKDALHFFSNVCEKNSKPDDVQELFPNWISLRNYEDLENVHLNFPFLIDFSKVYSDIMFSGFSGIEPQGRWTEGEKANIIFLKKFPESFKVQIDAYAFGPNIGKRIPVSVGSITKELILSDKIKTYYLSFNGVIPTHELVITVPNPVSPQELHRSNDNRKIGVFLHKMIISR